MIALDTATFEAWLRRQPPGQIVGWRGDCEDCPVARFLLDRGAEWAAAGDGFFHSDGNWQDNPAWVDRFMERVDARGTGFVTAEEALQILDEVC